MIGARIMLRFFCTIAEREREQRGKQCAELSTHRDLQFPELLRLGIRRADRTTHAAGVTIFVLQFGGYKLRRFLEGFAVGLEFCGTLTYLRQVFSVVCNVASISSRP